MKRLMIGVLAVGCLVLATVVAVVLLDVGQPRTVAALDHPDGQRVRLVQEFAGLDGFETTLYYDNGDGRWRWYYFDHDDTFWRTTDARYEGNEVSVGRSDRGALIDIENDIVTITNDEIGFRQSPLSAEIVELPAGLD